jgi:DNA-binding transcriptional MerR regulator
MADRTPPLTTTRVARLLDLSEDQTRRLADTGQLHVTRTASGTRLYSSADVARLVAARAEARARRAAEDAEDEAGA